ncbi:ABC transporter ATP-binding protein [Halobellus litoreus]|uniref:ABC transporter ATP-binding protein n=1 Tax=Halobellus litoreus TaxID=755310 RepID=A0ABD6DR50_9EURY|nr:ABC transporter ATP-binding protein [Halobellus litoreus]
MAAIETRSLSKRFGSLHAVRDLDLTVESGEVFGFLGPNGAGKSTTINILLDFVRRSSGDVNVLGYDPERNPQAVRQRIGVLSEGTGFYPRDTARDHVAFAIEMERAGDDPDAVLERVGIADAADRAVGGFSKGMRKRLGLAIALVGDPEILVLDEPLGGLDPEGAQRLREIIRAERDRGAAVFFSSHIMDQVEAICDRVGILHDGELVAVDTVDRLRTSVAEPARFNLVFASVPEDVPAAVRAVDGVTDVTVAGETVRVTCRDPAVKSAVVARVDSLDATIRDIDTPGSSLERVFRSVTDDADGHVDG